MPRSRILWFILAASVEERTMTDDKHRPGTGRSTADAAFTALTKEISDRNEAASKVGRARRDAARQEAAVRRRHDDGR